MSSEQKHDEGVEALLPTSTLHAFPVNTFAENIAVRPSGSLLICVHNTCSLYEVAPSAPSEAKLIHKFPAGLTGIVELVEPDTYYISVGNLGEKGSYSIYEVILSGPNPKISHFASIPDAIFLNGSCVLSQFPPVFLAVDSLIGAIFAVNAHTRAVTTWLASPLIGKVSQSVMPGANGVKVFEGYVYVSNTDARTMNRVKLGGDDKPHGEVEVIARDINVDDFCFDAEGNAYLTTHVFNAVARLNVKSGKRERICGGPESRECAGTTACAFGREKEDEGILYVTTNGGMSFPIGGVVGEGRVLRVEVGGSAKGDPAMHRVGK